MMSEEIVESQEVSQKSPFAGCAIFIIAALVMIFLIVFSVVVLFRQFNEIAKFTAVEPVKIQVEELEGREAELNQLAEKIELFRMSVIEGKTATLELNAGEMNLAIAAYDSFKDLRGMLRVREITNERIFFDISFKLNGKPRLAKEGEGGMMASDPRYLNGILETEPGLLGKEVVLQVREIEVQGAEVPKEFLEQMSPYRIAERYVGESEIGRVMAELTDLELVDGAIRFEKVSGEVSKDTVTDAQVDASSQRLFTFLGIAAAVFLFFVALILFIGLRSKRTTSDQDEPA